VAPNSGLYGAHWVQIWVQRTAGRLWPIAGVTLTGGQLATCSQYDCETGRIRGTIDGARAALVIGLEGRRLNPEHAQTIVAQETAALASTRSLATVIALSNSEIAPSTWRTSLAVGVSSMKEPGLSLPGGRFSAWINRCDRLC
jgi:hypothetical protein